jgi:hypothetical protein
MMATYQKNRKGKQMGIKTLYVPVDDRPQVKIWDDIDHILSSFGGEMITTYSTQIKGIGIIAGDQDDPGQTINHLGIRGGFVILGIEGEFGPVATIRSLEDHEIFGMKMGIEVGEGK